MIAQLSRFDHLANPPRPGRVEEAQQAREFIESMDIHGLREILAFLSSSEFMFMFLVVMAYFFYKKNK